MMMMMMMMMKRKVLLSPMSLLSLLMSRNDNVNIDVFSLVQFSLLVIFTC
jgi:hypothetical protein